MRQTIGGRTYSLYSSKMQLEEVCRRKTWHNWTLFGFMDTNSLIYFQEDVSSHSLCRSDLQLSHLDPSTKGGGRVQKCDTQINMYTGKKDVTKNILTLQSSQPAHLQESPELSFFLVTSLSFCLWQPAKFDCIVGELVTLVPIVIPGLQGFDVTAVIWRRKRAPTWQEAAVLFVCFMVKYLGSCVSVLLILKPISVSVEWDQCAIVSSSCRPGTALKKMFNHNFPFNYFFIV